MATINKQQLAESTESRGLDKAFSKTKPEILSKIKFLRRPTASVNEILRRENNFFVTGEAGLKELGVPSLEHFGKCFSPVLPNGEANPNFDQNIIMATVPKIAEVVYLLSCPTETLLDVYEGNADKVFKRGVALLMTEYSWVDFISMFPAVKAEFNAINRATAVIDTSDKEPKSKEPGKKKR